MKNKAFDDFSFKAISSQPSQAEIPPQEPKDIAPPKLIKPSDINFRHIVLSKPNENVFGHHIHQKISNISVQLQENIKRRVQLQKKLTILQNRQKKEKEREIFMAYSNNQFKQNEQIATKFKDIKLEADRIDSLLVPEISKSPPSLVSKTLQLQKVKKSLLKEDDQRNLNAKESILIPIMQTLSTYKPKPVPLYTVPDQIKIQQLLSKVTFPQIPKDNLKQLQKQVQLLLAKHQPHSDIHYLLMIIFYHLEQYKKVRKHFEQIVLFKVYNQRAYWISAETQFALDNYQLCLKMTEQCMKRLEDKLLPRLIHLKALCYDGLGNYINSIICYNQLIKLKPKISDYFLERALLYHRIGYYKEAKEDFIMFGVLRPDAQKVIKDRILAQTNQIKRKEYIALLAKLY